MNPDETQMSFLPNQPRVEMPENISLKDIIERFKAEKKLLELKKVVVNPLRKQYFGILQTNNSLKFYRVFCVDS